MGVRKEDILSFVFFQYGTPYTGECKGMRYYMARNPLKKVVYDSDPHKNDEALFDVVVWRGPMNFETTKEEKISTTFPFTEEGLEQAIEWLDENYNSKVDFWEKGMHLLPEKND